MFETEGAQEAVVSGPQKPPLLRLSRLHAESFNRGGSPNSENLREFSEKDAAPPTTRTLRNTAPSKEVTARERDDNPRCRGTGGWEEYQPHPRFKIRP